MKQVIFLFSIFSAFKLYSQDSFNLRVDSVIYEGASEFKIPKNDMYLVIENKTLKISGYSLFMEAGDSTKYTLAGDLVKSFSNEKSTSYETTLFYKNPSPDHNLKIIQYTPNSFKLTISSAAMATELYCSKK